MSFGRLRHRILPKCVPHVQHDCFSLFDQSDHCFLTSSLPLSSSWLKLTNSRTKCTNSIADDISAIVHGGWGEWSEWSACSLTCGLGKQTRDRKCNSPEPQYGGRPCNESERIGGKYCRRQRCEDIGLCTSSLFHLMLK